jgi:hypothetical protein
MPPQSRCPSDLTDEDWALLESWLASPEKRARLPKWSARCVADAPSTCSGAAAPGGCCPVSIRPGRRSTTICAGGASPVGSGECTTGWGRRCGGGEARPGP